MNDNEKKAAATGLRNLAGGLRNQAHALNMEAENVLALARTLDPDGEPHGPDWAKERAFRLWGEGGGSRKWMEANQPGIPNPWHCEVGIYRAGQNFEVFGECVTFNPYEANGLAKNEDGTPAKTAWDMAFEDASKKGHNVVESRTKVETETQH